MQVIILYLRVIKKVFLMKVTTLFQRSKKKDYLIGVLLMWLFMAHYLIFFVEN